MINAAAHGSTSTCKPIYFFAVRHRTFIHAHFDARCDGQQKYNSGFFKFFFIIEKNHLFSKMRVNSQNWACISRFSLSKLSSHLIKISYSESAKKTELNKIFFKSISQLSFFLLFRAYIWSVVVRLHSKKWKLSNSFERYFVQRSFFCWFRIWYFYFIEVNFWLRKSRTTSGIPTFSPHI